MRRSRRTVGLVALVGLVLTGALVAAVVTADRWGEGADGAPPPVATPRPPSAPPPLPAVAATTNDRVPILMYHVIADPPPGAPYPELYVAPAAFAAQVAWLAGHGYHAVTLSALHEHWTRGVALPARPIVLTFDDGYRSHFTAARPVLAANGWVAVLDLDLSNTEETWGLSVRRVRLLLDDGWELAAHSLTHPDLTQIDDARLHEEVAGARARLRNLFGVPVEFYCYPAGRYDDRVVKAVRDAGYVGATTTDDGIAGPATPYRLARLRISRSDGVAGLAEKLRLAEASVPARGSSR